MKDLSSLLLATTITFSTTSCSLQFMAEYRHIGEKVFRRGYHGNHLGLGSNGDDKPAVDAADELGKKHDIAYDRAKTFREVKWADRAFVEIGTEIYPTLSVECQEFMSGAIKFFDGPLANFFGKPFTKLSRNQDNCYWKSYNEVYDFMKTGKLNTADSKTKTIKQKY